MKTDKDMRKYRFSSWLENFVYEKNKCNEEDKITKKTLGSLGLGYVYVFYLSLPINLHL